MEVKGMSKESASEEKCLYFENHIIKRKMNSAGDNSNIDKQGEKFIDVDNSSSAEFVTVFECEKNMRTQIMGNEHLYLICKWKDCSFHTDIIDLFINHVADHIPAPPQGKRNSIQIHDNVVYTCLWNGCHSEHYKHDDMAKHVNYHSYHAKLKSIGLNIRGRVQLPKCRRGSKMKNLLSQSLDQICRWEGCSESFNNYQLYLWHVFTHVRIRTCKNGQLECKWRGCSKEYISLSKLRSHMKSHTKEKLIACPDCDATFSANSKFFHHCKTQVCSDRSAQKFKEIFSKLQLQKKFHALLERRRSQETETNYKRMQTQLRIEFGENRNSPLSHAQEEAGTIPEGYNFVESNSELREEFHAVMGEIKHEEINICEQSEGEIQIKAEEEEEGEGKFSVPYDEKAEVIPEGLCSVDLKSEPEEEFYSVKLEIIPEDESTNQVEFVDMNSIVPSEGDDLPKAEQNSELPRVISDLNSDLSSPSLCRICAIQSDDTVYIFDRNKPYGNIIEKIEHCLPVVVKETDTITKQVCQLCLHKLELSYQFRKTAVEAEKQLFKFDEANLSEELEEREEYCNLQYDAQNHEDNEAEEKFFPEEDMNGNVSMNIPNRLQGRDISSQNNRNFTNFKHYTNNLNEEIEIRITRDENQGEKSAIDALNYETTTSISQMKRNDHLEEDFTLRDALTPGFHVDASSITKNCTTSNVPRKKSRGYENDDVEECERPKICKLDNKKCRKFKDSGIAEQSSRNPYRKQIRNEKQLDPREIKNDDHGFECNFCKDNFHAKDTLDLHKKTGCATLANGKKFSCSDCGKLFLHKWDLNIHKPIHTRNDQPASCKFCNGRFPSRSVLEYHQRICNGECGLFECDICGKTFIDVTNLRAHRSTHLKKKALQTVFPP